MSRFKDAIITIEEETGILQGELEELENELDYLEFSKQSIQRDIEKLKARIAEKERLMNAALEEHLGGN